MTLEVTTKECTKCHEVKDLEEFYTQSRGKYGRKSRCKICSVSDELARRLKRKDSITYPKNKKCSKCNESKSFTEFCKHYGNKDGLSSYCRACDNKRTSKWETDNVQRANERKYRWAMSNPDKVTKASAEWAKRNPESGVQKATRYRAKKKQLFVEDFTLEQILERDGLGCAWCGVIPDEYHVDHVRPLDLKGVHAPFNLVASCVSCNTSKGAQEPAVWLAQRLSQGITGIPSPSALEATRLAYSGVHEELKAQIDLRNRTLH